MKKVLLKRMEYALARLALGILVRLPLGTSLGVGRGLGWLAWSVVRLRRAQVLENLQRSFPQKGEAALEALGRRCYRCLGQYFVEMFWLQRLSTEEQGRWISFEGWEIMEEALGGGMGVINVTFHYGNFEVMGAYAARTGLPLEVISRPQTNPYFERWLRKLRTSSGMGLIPVNASARTVIEVLRSGRIVSFLSDQDAHHVGVFVDFLNQPASTAKGPALFAFKTGAPVVLSIMVPQEDGKWKIIFERVPRPETKDKDIFIREMTAWYTSRLEDYIHQAPEHWFWPHRRWKTRPRG
ncbi:MAG: hypothetical protein A2Z86_04480 [Candidatus Glassbacteria bacterium GWA2_58_10]|uniref:Lipid A biosynthesis acyltransferase n=1 Tax=Candidatus Glassbacteria bacterium GWA2_58_10 TaxID=1817865 RepID=A0A1F5YGS5_9BACT|nr:MAG: hypothetical protein A2Z86_04480 [Candidatus Glassbacteria bacterium GWA2_58_10]